MAHSSTVPPGTTSADTQRVMCMSMHPSSRSHQLVARVESLHKKALESSAHHPTSFAGRPDDGITLALHGDLDAKSAPHLQAVLDAVAHLQPSHLRVDLSDVGHIDRYALARFERCGDALEGWSFLTPSSVARADLEKLGHLEFAMPEFALSVSA